MRVPRLYVEQALSSGETIVLPRNKAHHLLKVLRMNSGNEIILFDDSGYEFDSVIIELAKKNVEVKIRESRLITNESSLKLTLCLAISRTQHMDFSIQKAVELGVNKIIPVMSEFSNVKLQGSRVQNKITHWQNIIINATEQCGRASLTELIAPVSFSECLNLDSPETRLILHPGSQQAMPTITLDNNELAIMIGPEGGFSDVEVKEAKERSYLPISLGPRILRAETAVISALSNAQQLWGDLN